MWDYVSESQVLVHNKALISGNIASKAIWEAGKKVFDKFKIADAYVKPKHLSTTTGKARKFLGNTKAEAESLLKEAMKKGDIKSILDNGLTGQGTQSYAVFMDAGKTIGTKGERLIKIVLSEDGGMLSAYPVIAIK